MDRGAVLIGPDEPAMPRPGRDVDVYYLPLLLWPVLPLAVAWDYRRRFGLGVR